MVAANFFIGVCDDESWRWVPYAAQQLYSKSGFRVVWRVTLGGLESILFEKVLDL